MLAFGSTQQSADDELGQPNVTNDNSQFSMLSLQITQHERLIFCSQFSTVFVFVANRKFKAAKSHFRLLVNSGTCVSSRAFKGCQKTNDMFDGENFR